MSQADLGSYTYTLAIAGPIFLLAQSNLVSFMLADRFMEYSMNIYIKHRLYLSTIAITVLSLATYFLDTDIFILAIIIGTIKACESMHDLDLGLLQIEGRASKIIWKCLVRYSLLALVGYFYLQQQKLTTGILALLIANIALLLILELKPTQSNSNTKPQTRDNNVRNLARKTVPLGLVMIVASLGANTPVYFIEYFNDKSSVAKFSVLFYFILIGRMFIAALCQSKIHKLSHSFINSKHQFKKISLHLNTRIVALGLLSFATLYLAGNPIVTLLYGDNFRASDFTMTLIGSYMIISFIAQAQNTITTAIGKGNLIIYIELVHLFILPILLFFIIPIYAIEGAFISMLAAAIIHCSLSIFLQSILSANKK